MDKLEPLHKTLNQKIPIKNVQRSWIDPSLKIYDQCMYIKNDEIIGYANQNHNDVSPVRTAHQKDKG